ncbi:MAG: hypothetical protein WCJ68_04305 [Chitinophagia bacterium]|jgi:hypothetical protein
MHRIVLLLLPIWLPTLLLGQDLSGKWKGVFTPNQDQEGKVYSYELDIKELPNHSLSVVTYTKLSNNFSAKAIATGMHSENTELVSVIETKFENMRLLGNFQACLMSNYLTYNTIRGKATLEGTYISSNSKMGKDCGSGTVYLEKEIPIVQLNIKNKQKSPPAITEIVKNKNSTVQKTTSFAKNTIATNSPAIIQDQNSIPSNTSKASPLPPATTNSTNTSVVANPVNNDKAIAPTKADNTGTAINTEIAKQSNRGQILPYALVGRENKLVKTITVNTPHISFDMFDNGTIDNDTIMVYDNKVQLLNDQRLSYKSIHFELDFNNNVPSHEIIIVAKNLGTVPPNTALMILKDGSSRKEYYITTTLQTNAMLIINYKAPN